MSDCNVKFSLHDLQQSHQKGVFGLKKGKLRKIFCFGAEKGEGEAPFLGRRGLTAFPVTRRSFFC